jgi:hypothetical protein
MMERAPFMDAWRAKKISGVIAMATAAQGNAATRVEAFVISSSPLRVRRVSRHRRALSPAVAGARPEEARGAALSDPAADERARQHGPIFEPATLHGVGPRVEEAAIGLNPLLYRRAVRGHAAEEAVRMETMPHEIRT